jgi:hypothetical protein
VLDKHGKPRLEIVPRWEWPELKGKPQPIPERVVLHGDATDEYIGVARTWGKVDPSTCKLCATCSVFQDGGDVRCLTGMATADVLTLPGVAEALKREGERDVGR